MSDGLPSWESVRSRRVQLAKARLIACLHTYSPEARANNIKLMRAYLSARPAEKLELGGRLLALDLEIWKLPTDAAERFLDEMERCQ